MPQKRKYSDNDRMAAFDLFCEGLQPKHVAEKMGWSRSAVSRLKASKWPEDWDKARAERNRKKVEIIEKKGLDNLGQSLRRRQARINNMQIASSNAFVKKAMADQIGADVAAETFAEMCRLESELYVPPDQLHGPKGRFGIAAASTSDGSSVVLGFMESVYKDTRED